MTDQSEGDDNLDAHREPARVRAVYEDIATHFSKTRAYPWPEVEKFLDGVSHGQESLSLDAGCGNGRHSALLAEVTERVLALDVSRGLLLEARERLGESATVTLLQGDAASLPVSDGCVDVAVYVATLHHLPDRDTRVESLRELRRVLAPGGRALVSAWSVVHDRFDADPNAEAGFDTTVDWTLPGGETVPRFYHIYASAEFDADLRAAGLVIEESFVSSGNCYAVCCSDSTA
jgi:ubiquinone/menaquinone biosynthesis C-methylase UbiE